VFKTESISAMDFAVVYAMSLTVLLVDEVRKALERVGFLRMPQEMPGPCVAAWDAVQFGGDRAIEVSWQFSKWLFGAVSSVVTCGGLCCSSSNGAKDNDSEAERLLRTSDRSESGAALREPRNASSKPGGQGVREIAETPDSKSGRRRLKADSEADL